MKWLALDIGGANVKVADGLEHAESSSFALWREPEHLTQELRTLIAQAPHCDRLAVTMTGELADCFENKAEGVAFILDAVDQAADGRHTRVYLNDGSLVTSQVARRRPASVAAANWHALACFATRFTDGQPSLLLDVGSTTCDVIPLLDDAVATDHRSDTDRLLHGELIYAGVERTPICSLVSELPYRGQSCPIARELFATTADVYILLGQLAEQSTNCETADGRAATKAASRSRIARMICADDENFNHRDAIVAAEAVDAALVRVIRQSIEKVTSAYSLVPFSIILSGHGAFAARLATDDSTSCKHILLANEIGQRASRCAPAHALAILAREATGV
jgi:(4-(4-[2-(gamma-L-glutamylamino)ethyl]phenoxymethyl)furan-2-yl)methanamine synthase